MNPPVIVYFHGTIAEQVAALVAVPHIAYAIESNLGSVEEIVHKLQVLKPPLIIALGSYSGRDSENLRIECLCNTKWRNTTLSQFPITYIRTALHETKVSKFTYKHGNSWCNLLSLQAINTEEISNVYNFIHIPKTFHVELAAQEIINQLELISK